VYLASYLAAILPASWLTWADALVFVPADRAAKRRRGFDHLHEVADDLAYLTGLKLFDLLEKLPAADQRRLDREQRFINLSHAFLLTAPAKLLPQHIILIDDVFTTGATLDAAASALLMHGAEEVRVATIARVW